jgi:hypothetical protein
VRQVTRDGSDVLGVVGVDDARGEVYVSAAAPTPTSGRCTATRSAAPAPASG